MIITNSNKQSGFIIPIYHNYIYWYHYYKHTYIAVKHDQLINQKIVTGVPMKMYQIGIVVNLYALIISP